MNSAHVSSCTLDHARARAHVQASCNCAQATDIVAFRQLIVQLVLERLFSYTDVYTQSHDYVYERQVSWLNVKCRGSVIIKIASTKYLLAITLLILQAAQIRVAVLATKLTSSCVCRVDGSLAVENDYALRNATETFREGRTYTYVRWKNSARLRVGIKIPFARSKCRFAAVVPARCADAPIAHAMKTDHVSPCCALLRDAHARDVTK